MAQTSPGRDVIDPNGASTNFATVETHQQLYKLARQRQQQQHQPHRHNQTKNNRYQAENEFHASSTTDMKVKKKTSNNNNDNITTTTSVPTLTDKGADEEQSIKSTNRQTTFNKPNQIPLAEEPARPKEIFSGNKVSDAKTYHHQPNPAFGFDPNLLFLENQKLLQNVEKTTSLLFPQANFNNVNNAATNNKHNKHPFGRNAQPPPALHQPGLVSVKTSKPLIGEESEKVEHLLPNVNTNKNRQSLSNRGNVKHNNNKNNNNNRHRIFKNEDMENGSKC